MGTYVCTVVWSYRICVRWYGLTTRAIADGECDVSMNECVIGGQCGIQVRVGRYGGGRAGRAAGLGAGAAAARARARLRPAHLRRGAAHVRAARVLLARRRAALRRALLPARLPRHAHAQPHLVHRSRRRVGEPPRSPPSSTSTSTYSNENVHVTT